MSDCHRLSFSEFDNPFEDRVSSAAPLNGFQTECAATKAAGETAAGWSKEVQEKKSSSKIIKMLENWYSVLQNNGQFIV